MKRLSNIFLLISILFTSIILIVSGMRGMGEEVPNLLIDIPLQVMHISFILGSIFTVYVCYKENYKMYMVLFFIPLILLLVSIVLLFFSIRFPSLLLFIFDIYILVLSVNFLTIISNN